MKYWTLGFVTLLATFGCVSTDLLGPNAFLTLAEEFGAESLNSSDDGTTGGGGGTGGIAADLVFRQPLTLTLANGDTTAQLEVLFTAWVLPSSIRDTEQEDQLIEDGYVRVTAETQIGKLSIPIGSFIRNGGGFAGATRFLIEPSGQADVTMITPDVLLVYNDVPTSCESVAFEFLIGGESIVSDIFRNDSTDAATNNGGRKSLAQIDAYQCSPFEPGLYFRAGGGARATNEFFEGQSVRFDFIRTVLDNGDAAFVTFQ